MYQKKEAVVAASFSIYFNVLYKFVPYVCNYSFYTLYIR